MSLILLPACMLLSDINNLPLLLAFREPSQIDDK